MFGKTLSSSKEQKEGSFSQKEPEFLTTPELLPLTENPTKL